MTKKVLLATIAVLVAWFACDYVIHELILGSTYATVSNMFRPKEEMKMGVMFLVMLISSFSFAGLYGWFVKDKNLTQGLKFGLLWGVGVGIGMGHGTYSVMPIPYFMALTWFLGTVVEGAVAGLIAGAILKD